MTSKSASEELLHEFLVESYENLDKMDQDFVALEQDPTDREILAQIFRRIHTIKGSCGFLGFAQLEGLTHAAENLLSLLREGKQTITTDLTNTLLRTADTVREALAIIEQTGTEPKSDYGTLIDALNRLRQADDGASQASESVDVPAKDAEPTVIRDEGDVVIDFATRGYECLATMDQAFTALQEQPDDRSAIAALLEATSQVHSEVEFLGLRPLERLATSGLEVLKLLQSGPLLWTDAVAVGLQDMADRIGEAVATIETTKATPGEDYTALIEILDAIRSETGTIIIDDGASAAVNTGTGTDQKSSVAEPTPAAVSRGSGIQSNLTDSHIRVDVELLDRLMNQVGELVLSRNQLTEHLTNSVDSDLAKMSQHLNQITTELQESVMAARLQPIGTIWGKYPRMIRDLALELGKQVSLRIEGADTELDRTLIEAIKDPMTHLVRNAIDHGIESPDERQRAGKSAEGTLLLHAYHEGGQVNIEISDDGKGIDVKQVARRACERGLITAEQEDSMTEREKLGLIFAPGFSTVEEVTNISGRGVGMDVVKSHIERINGIVDIKSEPGAGTRIKVKIPLTLAIIPALIVTCAEQRYAIAQASLIAVIRLQGEEVRSGIETLHNVPVYRWRGGLLPLVDFRQLLKAQVDGIVSGELPEVVNIVVLQAEERSFGLIVDRIDDSVEIVVKALGQHLRKIPIYAGATIMGDGKAALIIDVMGLAQSANVVSEPGTRGFPEQEPETSQENTNKRMVVLVRSGGKRFAIPAYQVERIEKFSRAAIEKSGENAVVQYRGSVMPLRSLIDETTTNVPTAGNAWVEDQRAQLDVIVRTHNGRNLGLVVDEILDVLEDEIEVVASSDQTGGRMGTAIIRNKVAEFIDIDKFTAL